jgi:dsDNA-specific endonuclease/ATPase MutS2
MNKKDLEKLGLTAEVIEKAGLGVDIVDQIIVLHGKDIEKHKTDLTTATEQATELQKQLDEANKTIDGFKGMKIEEIQKAAEEYKVAAETAKTEAEKKIAELKFDHALESALTAAKVKDPADVIPHIKKDSLKLDGEGKFVGLEEQLKTLKESKDYLFNSENPDPQIVIGAESQNGGDAITAAVRKGAGLPPS